MSTSTTNKADTATIETRIIAEITQNPALNEAKQEKRGFFRESFKSIREATAKFITVSASHHMAMLSNIRGEVKFKPGRIIFNLGFVKIRTPFPSLTGRLAVAPPKAIFANLKKPQPIHLKARIQKLKEFKINDSNRDKILDAIIKEKIKRLKKDQQYLIIANDELKQKILRDLVDGEGNSLEGEALWEKLHDLDPTENKTVYRKLMLQEAGLRGKRYAAEMVQNGIKLATIVGIPGIALAAGGGLAIGGAALGGMLIGSRLLSMASYPILNAITAYQDNLAGRGYTGAEVLRAGLNNLPLAIAATLLGSTAGSFIQKEVGKLIANIGGSEAVKYGLNTMSRIMFMSGSAAAANILSGWLQSRHFNIEKQKINDNKNLEKDEKNERLKEFERRERIAKGVVLAATPVAAGIFALNQEAPHVVENAANQVARIEAQNTYNPAENLVSNYQSKTKSDQPLGGLAPGMKMLNPLGNSDLEPFVATTQIGTRTQTVTPQSADLNLESYVTNGPAEWGAAAGLVEESINYIRTTHTNDVLATFGQINITLSQQQINEIKAGKISEETINELLRASVVMQQGLKLYPNGSASEIFDIFKRRANAETRGGVLDGYARLNDAPADNPYKTVQGILVDNLSAIENNLASVSNLANITSSTSVFTSPTGAAGGVDNTLNVDLSGFNALPVDTSVTDTGTNGQFNGFGSIESLANFQRSILASTELSTEQKTQLLQFSRDLAQSTDGGVLAQSINQFFGGKEFSPKELLPVLRKSQDHGFYNPLESDVRNRVKPAITVQEYANAPKGDFKRNWGASDVVKENYIQLEGEKTELSLYDILRESYDRGNFYNDDLDWVPQELIDIAKDQMAYLKQTWNGLPDWAQVGIGLGAVIFLLREGNLRFMPYEVLPKWAKRTRVRRWLRRRNIPQDKKEEFLNYVDQLIDTNGFLKRGQWKIKQREIKKTKKESLKKSGGIRIRLLNRILGTPLRARVTGTRFSGQELIESIEDVKKTIKKGFKELHEELSNGGLMQFVKRRPFESLEKKVKSGKLNEVEFAKRKEQILDYARKAQQEQERNRKSFEQINTRLSDLEDVVKKLDPECSAFIQKNYLYMMKRLELNAAIRKNKASRASVLISDLESIKNKLVNTFKSEKEKEGELKGDKEAEIRNIQKQQQGLVDRRKSLEDDLNELVKNRENLTQEQKGLYDQIKQILNRTGEINLGNKRLIWRIKKYNYIYDLERLQGRIEDLRKATEQTKTS